MAEAQKTKPSRTMSVALWGIWTIMLLSVEVLVAMALGIRGDDLTTFSGVIGTLSAAAAAIAGGGALSIGARHWGAKEPSSAREDTTLVPLDPPTEP